MTSPHSAPLNQGGKLLLVVLIELSTQKCNHLGPLFHVYVHSFIHILSIYPELLLHELFC